MSVCLSISLSHVCMSVCLSIGLSVCPSVRLSACLSFRPSVCLSLCLSVVNLSIYHPSICGQVRSMSLVPALDEMVNVPKFPRPAVFCIYLSIYVPEQDPE